MDRFHKLISYTEILQNPLKQLKLHLKQDKKKKKIDKNELTKSTLWITVADKTRQPKISRLLPKQASDINANITQDYAKLLILITNQFLTEKKL